MINIVTPDLPARFENAFACKVPSIEFIHGVNKESRDSMLQNIITFSAGVVWILLNLNISNVFKIVFLSFLFLALHFYIKII